MYLTMSKFFAESKPCGGQPPASAQPSRLLTASSASKCDCESIVAAACRFLLCLSKLENKDDSQCAQVGMTSCSNSRCPLNSREVFLSHLRLVGRCSLMTDRTTRIHHTNRDCYTTVNAATSTPCFVDQCHCCQTASSQSTHTGLEARDIVRETFPIYTPARRLCTSDPHAGHQIRCNSDTSGRRQGVTLTAMAATAAAACSRCWLRGVYNALLRSFLLGTPSLLLVVCVAATAERAFSCSWGYTWICRQHADKPPSEIVSVRAVPPVPSSGAQDCKDSWHQHLLLLLCTCVAAFS